MFDIFLLIDKFKKKITSVDILIFVGIIGLYLLTRLINLDSLPIFGDEGIYVRWAKVAWHDASWRFISLTDGKQPLQTWGTIPFLKILPEYPLIAGRLFSVFTGLFALFGFFVTGTYLWSKKAGFLSATLYVITPFFLFYDRMALVDSAVNAFAVWMFLFSIILARNMRVDIALIYGFLSGFALLAKSSVRIFLGLGFAAYFFMHVKSKLQGKNFLRSVVNFTVLYALTTGISIAMYNVQRLSPFFHYVAEKNKTFILTFEEFMQAPFAFVLSNSRIIIYYVFGELGFIIGFFGLIGIVMMYVKNRRMALYFGLWLIVPFVIIALVSKVIFPRYLIFFGSFLTLLAGYALISINNKKMVIVSVIAILTSAMYFDYTILFDQKNIPFPEVDKGQYITGITAGWGIDEIIAYSRRKAMEKKVILLAEGNFGVIGDQLDAHLTQHDQIFIKGYWPLKKEDIIEAQTLLKDNYVYVVFSHQVKMPADWPIKLVRHYPKPGNKAHIYFAEVLPR